MTRKQPKRWVFSPSKPAKAAVPMAVKAEVEAKANEFIDTVLKPKHVEPPPENPRFNYLADITCKWHGSFFYLIGVYACPPRPDAGTRTFESKMARLLYVGPNRFDLGFQRHTGQWIDLYTGLPLEKCLETIRDDPWFIPT
jgi:hypothetical protein